MILTLTINPAIDRIVTVDRLVFEDRGYILSRSQTAGGRGVNASQVLTNFGAETSALLTSGGAAGECMEDSLTAMGIPYEAVRVRAETRVNLTVSDKQGLTIKMNEVGAELSPADVAAVRKLVEAKLPETGWLMICGSIQPGVPTDFYSDIIQLAQSRNVKTLLDTDGDALVRGLEAKPSVITPNQAEAERLLGRAIITRSQSLEAVQRIHAMGADAVVLSLGARGAIALAPEGLFEAAPPRIDALCPIGAGDALAAALVWAMDANKPFPDALRWGVAAGTAAAALPGISFPTLDQTSAVYAQVEVRPV